ncbi:MAG: MipA/OmpV family protein, partial [Psychrosphaera sp.]|nr:MipA/OmpV family protein [Psychrosphaera sp.]
IDQADGVDPLFYYQGSASIHPYVKVSAMYPLDEQWDLVGLARWSKIGSGMADSPVVEENTASTLYAGVSYAF